MIRWGLQPRLEKMEWAVQTVGAAAEMEWPLFKRSLNVNSRKPSTVTLNILWSAVDKTAAFPGCFQTLAHVLRCLLLIAQLSKWVQPCPAIKIGFPRDCHRDTNSNEFISAELGKACLDMGEQYYGIGAEFDIVDGNWVVYVRVAFFLRYFEHMYAVTYLLSTLMCCH